MNQALQHNLDIDPQLGNTSSSDLNARFSKIISSEKSIITKSDALNASMIDTPLGPMVAIADDSKLYLLEFMDCHRLEREHTIISGKTKPIISIENELHDYFSGQLTEFKTPIYILGSDFQKRVWKELQKIPAAETRSYADIANAIGAPTAYRAVGQANGANQLAIIIPCHRVINRNGELGGYAGGITRKKWLLNHELEF